MTTPDAAPGVDTDVIGSVTEPASPELEQFLSSLQSSGPLKASVYRIRDDGSTAFVPGPLAVPDPPDADELLNRLAKKVGPGAFRLQFRKPRGQGTLRWVDVIIDGPAEATDVAPKAPEANPLIELLREQVRDLKELVKEVVTRKPEAPPPPALTAEEIVRIAQRHTPVAELEKQLAFSRRISESTQAELPPWLRSIGQSFGPFLAAMFAGAAGAAQQAKAAAAAGQGQGTNVADADRAAAAARAADAAANVVRHGAPRPAAATAPRAAALPHDRPPIVPKPKAPEVSAEVEAATVAILNQAASEDQPDAKMYAGLFCDIGKDDLAAVCAQYPEGAIAKAIHEKCPALGERPWIARDIETEIRVRLGYPVQPGGARTIDIHELAEAIEGGATVEEPIPEAELAEVPG